MYFFHVAITINLLFFCCVLVPIIILLQVLTAVAILNDFTLEVARIIRQHKWFLLSVLPHIGCKHGLTYVILVVETSLASVVIVLGYTDSVHGLVGCWVICFRPIVFKVTRWSKVAGTIDVGILNFVAVIELILLNSNARLRWFFILAIDHNIWDFLIVLRTPMSNACSFLLIAHTDNHINVWPVVFVNTDHVPSLPTPYFWSTAFGMRLFVSPGWYWGFNQNMRVFHLLLDSCHSGSGLGIVVSRDFSHHVVAHNKF